MGRLSDEQQVIINSISEEIHSCMLAAKSEQYHPSADADKMDMIIRDNLEKVKKLREIRDNLEVIFTGVILR
jgi:hypothetical protein